MKSRIVTVLYDWDGTLVKFRGERFLRCMNAALGKLGYPLLPDLKNSKSIRHTFTTITQCFKKSEEALKIFRHEFTKLSPTEADFMPGAKSIIERIHEFGLRQGIVSNLDDEILKAEVKKLDLNKYFSVVFGTKNDDELKPNPYLIREALKKVGIPQIHRPQNKGVLYIGDNLGDIIAANKAGCTSILVSSQPIQTEADITITNLVEIEEIIKSGYNNANKIIRSSPA